MIKKYYIDNESYGTDALNQTTNDLRTTGIYGELAGCLEVTADSGTTVNIADGYGWVDGCKIEVTGGTTLLLPTVNNTYSVKMALDKDGDTVNDIKFDYESGSITGDHILAWVTIASGAITNIVDKRKPSTFKGATQLSPVFTYGTATYDEGVAKGASVTKAISIPVGFNKLKIFFSGYYSYMVMEMLPDGKGFIYGTDFGTIINNIDVFTVINSGSGQLFGERMSLTNVNLSSGNISFTFKAQDNYIGNLKTKIRWEAM